MVIFALDARSVNQKALDDRPNPITSPSKKTDVCVTIYISKIYLFYLIKNQNTYWLMITQSDYFFIVRYCKS